MSVVFLASELVRGGARHTVERSYPWLVAFTFGLLHGLGFAGALAEVGLPQGEIPLALFAFNVGVELGQLAFVAAVLSRRRLIHVVPLRLPAWRHLDDAAGSQSSRQKGGREFLYSIKKEGTPASFRLKTAPIDDFTLKENEGTAD